MGGENPAAARSTPPLGRVLAYYPLMARSAWLLGISLLLLTLACGDDDASVDGGAADASVDAQSDGGEPDAGRDAETDAGDLGYIEVGGGLAVEVRLSSDTVSEDGTRTIQGTLRLSEAPMSVVDLALFADDETEVVVEPRTMRFTSRAWDPIDFTIAGVDDAFADGDQSVGLSYVGSSADSRFAGTQESFTFVVNLDDEALLEGVSHAAVGPTHACAVQTGRVLCWGEGTQGALGHDIAIARYPLAVDTISDAVAVTVGDAFSCVRRASDTDTPGAVSCWGAGAAGQLGDGSMSDSAAPVSVSGLSDAVSIAAGPDFACAVRATGEVVCWGAGALGQLGDGLGTSAGTPQTVVGIDDAIAVVAGGAGACALRGVGGVRCWGQNDAAQASGLHASEPVLSAQNVAGIANVVELSASDDAFCALRNDDAIRGWGANTHNQLGDRSGLSTAEQLQPVAPLFDRAGDVAHIAGGARHHCATTRDLRLVCWGATDDAIIGNGPQVLLDGDLFRVDARSYASLTTASAEVFAGGAHACVLTDTRLRCLGPAASPVLAADGWEASPEAEAAPLGLAAHELEQIVATPTTTCARSRTNEVRCWGGALSAAAYDGSQGHGGTVAWSIPGPLAIFDEASTNDRPNLLTAGPLGLCGRVFDNGHVHCWGGLGSPILFDGAERTWGGLHDTRGNINASDGAVLLALGERHLCWHHAGLPPFCYGPDEYGQLGDADGLVGSALPARNLGAQVLGVGVPVTLAAGNSHTCALESEGRVMCWGRNHLGQLGDGTLGDRPSAVEANALSASDVSAIACGGDTTCVIVDEELRCAGAVADTNATSAEVFGVSGVDAVVLSRDTAHPAGCARVDGALHCWGVLGGTWESPFAVPRTFGSDVEHFAVGGDHVCWGSDNAIRCRGNSANGALGDYDLLALRFVGAESSD